jgi:phospholipase C
LLRGGAAAAGLWAVGCSSSSGSSSATTARRTTTTAKPTTTTTRPRQVGERPDASKPEGTHLIPEIEHVVVMMMENHSYDNYFGMLDRGDGFDLDSTGRPTNSNPQADGTPLKAFHMANTCQLEGKPSQNWNASHAQWNNGANDGFVTSDSGPVAMGYWTGDDLPFYYGFASTFPVCDRWFGSCLAQTYPNRRFLLAGTAAGDIRTSNDEIFTMPPASGTIMDLLNRNTIPWRDYYTDLPTTGLFVPVLQANPDKAPKIEQFFADAAAGTLPAFAIVDPDYENQSEEDPKDISLGEAIVSKVVNAVLASPAWKSTVFIWLYDEHGGYYDHVPPPPAVVPDNIPPRLQPGDVPGTYDRYGFRVPAIVAAPFAKRDYVSHVVHDHTSVLSLVEHVFNLPAMTARDAAADPLLDALDLEGDPAFLRPPTLPAPKNPSDTTRLCTAPGPVPNPAG